MFLGNKSSHTHNTRQRNCIVFSQTSLLLVRFKFKLRLPIISGGGGRGVSVNLDIPISMPFDSIPVIMSVGERGGLLRDSLRGLQRPKEVESSRRPISHGGDRVSTIHDVKGTTRPDLIDHPDVIEEEVDLDDDVIAWFHDVSNHNYEAVVTTLNNKTVDVDEFNEVCIGMVLVILQLSYVMVPNF